MSSVLSIRGDTLKRITRVKACAARLGIAVHTGSRVDFLEQQLKKFAHVKQDDLQRKGFDWISFTEGMRDIHELDFICRALADKASEQMKQLLGTAVTGAVLHHRDQNPSARNIQFQLFVSAVFERSGLPVSLTEPDIIFRCNGSEYGIAAKRILSRTQLEKRLKEGKSQLDKAGLKGIIAVCFDRLLPQKAARAIYSSEEGIEDAAKHTLRGILVSEKRKILPILAEPSVLGTIAFLAVPGVCKTANLRFSLSSAAISSWADKPEAATLAKSVCLRVE